MVHHARTRAHTTHALGQVGRREKDMRNHVASLPPGAAARTDVGDDKRGVAAALRTRGLIDGSLSWADIAWLRSLSGMKLVRAMWSRGRNLSDGLAAYTASQFVFIDYY